MKHRLVMKDGKLYEPWYWRQLRLCMECYPLQATLYVMGRLPWFARKRLLNWYVGQEFLTDFMFQDKCKIFDVEAGYASFKW